MTLPSFRQACLGLAAGLAFAALAAPVQAAGERVIPPAQSWSFSGPFGKFDRAQLQRGFKVVKEVCANCHSMSLIRLRNLSQPGGPEFTPGQVTALAATYTIKDGPNETGEMFDRPGRAATPSRRHSPMSRRRGRPMAALSARPVGAGQGAHL